MSELSDFEDEILNRKMGVECTPVETERAQQDYRSASNPDLWV